MLFIPGMTGVLAGVTGGSQEPPGPSEPAWSQILERASDDGWAFLYDFNNPNTWTLEDQGANKHYASVADGLGNRAAIANATSARRPKQIQKVGHYFGEFSDDFLYHTTGDMAQPITYICVVEIRLPTATKSLFCSARAGSGTYIHQFLPSASTNFTAHCGASWATSSGSRPTTLMVYTAIANGASSRMRINGSQIGAGGNGNNQLRGFCLGANDAPSNSSSFDLNGDVGLVMAYPGDLNGSSKLTTMEALLMSLYGLA